MGICNVTSFLIVRTLAVSELQITVERCLVLRTTSSSPIILPVPNSNNYNHIKIQKYYYTYINSRAYF
jgi:hypothetical protein